MDFLSNVRIEEGPKKPLMFSIGKGRREGMSTLQLQLFFNPAPSLY